MFDIITFGSATRDTFLKIKKESYEILKSKEFLTGKGLCFSLGSKVEIEDLIVSTGGGGTNTAATLTNQGFKVAYVGKIGKDKRGEAVMDDLKKFSVFTGFVRKDKSRPTAFSVVLSSGPGRGTILVYRGACHFLTKEEIPFEKLKAQWFYLAPLSGSLAYLFDDIIRVASRKKIKVMVNPGHSQINFKKSVLNRVLPQINILNLNQQEASLLTGIPFEKEKKLFKKLDQMIDGIAIMTKGEKGVVVSDGHYLWSAPALSASPVDVTGAGDAFGSGFLSGLIQTNDVSFAIQLGTANATSCIKKIGAKNGLLKKGKLSSKNLVKVKKIKL
jgi:ribokinase